MDNEPVAWTDGHFYVSFDKTGICSIPLYTHPVKELTDEEIEEVIRKHWNKEYGNRNMLTLCRAILRKAQEK